MTDQFQIIEDAILRVVSHVRIYARIGAWDISHQPTEAEISAREEEVITICDQIEVLAKRVRESDVYFDDFEFLRARLGDLSAYAKPEDILAVASAFLNAGRLQRPSA